MNGLTRRYASNDPFRRLVEHVLGDALGAASAETVSSRGWVPPVDIKETEDAVSLFVELPGLGKGDVNLSVEHNVLTLSGERKFEKDTDEDNYHRIERSYGVFSRSFTLPNNVRTDGVEASFKDGVLTILIPKVEEAKPRKIAIK